MNFKPPPTSISLTITTLFKPALTKLSPTRHTPPCHVHPSPAPRAMHHHRHQEAPSTRNHTPFLLVIIHVYARENPARNLTGTGCLDFPLWQLCSHALSVRPSREGLGKRGGGKKWGFIMGISFQLPSSVVLFPRPPPLKTHPP